MFKTKTSFISLVVLLAMFGCYSFGGDIIYIIKRTLDERVATLERKVALMDLYFSERGIDLEKAYGNRIQLVQEGGVRRDSDGPVIIINEPRRETPSPRNQGRYLVTFKDGSKMVIVTFEKTKTSYEDFDRGIVTKEVYTFILENGKKATFPIKSVDDMKFIPYNQED